MNTPNPKLDWFFHQPSRWQQEMQTLRSLVLECGLTEELKWGNPCYTDQHKNIVIIHAFKEYCALLFFKGALLKDTASILIRQTENVQEGRQVRFTGLEEIEKLRPLLKAYIFEAIEVEKLGLKVERKKTEEFPMPEEFREKLNELPELKAAFEALTPGRQRAYLLHFGGSKQSRTRTARIERWIPQIMIGKGFNEM